MNRLADTTALVTGAAVGIGRAIAHVFATEGARIAVTDVDASGAEQTALAIQADGGHARAYTLDVTDEAAWAGVIGAVENDLGPIDVLVNNAGIYVISPLAETPLAEWQRVQDVNVTGVFLGMKHVAPGMVARGRGSIVNLSSVAGLIGAAGHVAYGASKGAVRIMTKDAALELAASGVRVNSIHPGYIDTAMAAYGAAASGVETDELGALHPIGRIGAPEDVAWGAVYLASPEAGFVTGSELVIDGGYTSQ